MAMIMMAQLLFNGGKQDTMHRKIMFDNDGRFSNHKNFSSIFKTKPGKITGLHSLKTTARQAFGEKITIFKNFTKWK